MKLLSLLSAMVVAVTANAEIEARLYQILKKNELLDQKSVLLERLYNIDTQLAANATDNSTAATNTTTADNSTAATNTTADNSTAATNTTTADNSTAATNTTTADNSTAAHTNSSSSAGNHTTTN
jgi:hypothetical protein